MITLTREEAQQVLDALQCATPPTFSAKIVEAPDLRSLNANGRG
jgi:hypothetical protein